MSLQLTRTEENAAEIDALTTALSSYGGGRVGLAPLLADLPQRLRRSFAPGRAVARALSWERADGDDQTWFPQGVTNSYRTEVTRDLLLVSWYSKTRLGARISVLDLATRRYRHVLLVAPTESGDVVPVQAHAGGIVWQGSFLHVAATARGLLTFRLDDLLLDPRETHGYRYLLPVRYSYRAEALEGTERLRYSFLSLDRTGPDPALVVGEYGSATQTQRLARFGLDTVTGALSAGADGITRPLRIDESGQARMQGASVVDGRYFVTVSHGPWGLGSVMTGLPGSFQQHRWATPMGPEDLCYHSPSGMFWSVSEHPGRRWVYAMERSTFSL
ncbi:hypothetical protein [Nocardioides sp. CER19]|uniref:hypothetical protein n=1 Tax=Nocardioides sp. CER19 TaxID=3038538 RepID=UPI00244CA544|nr:hypothetical protein [Nocardioides sp. CER19]MDH2414990.1 hypothetical protein [Nocardioides sp. CER19]